MIVPEGYSYPVTVSTASLAEDTKEVFQMNFLNGYKTLIGGVVLIGIGIADCVQGNFDTGIQRIGEGIVAIGLGSKLDRR